jgi:hypothetical protein
LATIPFITIPPRRTFRVPMTFAVCFGESGCRIWSHLIFYNKNSALLPMIVENERSIQTILKPMGQRMVTIISRLDEPLLTKTLPVVEQIPKNQRVKVTGLFIYPAIGVDDLSSAIVANCNLKRAYQTLDHIRVVNLPDYDSNSAKPQFPLQFYDDKMSDPEKQIVWEILRSEQQTITKHKKGARL